MSITDALICLLISVENGKTAVFEDSSDRVIRAEWIRHLVLGLSWPIEVHERWKQKNSAHILPEAGGAVQIGYQGLRIHGAKIVGTLDLSNCGSTQSPLPALSFQSCSFEYGAGLDPTIDLSNASLCGLDLEDSRFRYLRGVGMAVAGSVNLSGIRPFDESDHALCWCKLSLCKIDGNLLAHRVKIRAPNRTTITQLTSENFPDTRKLEDPSARDWGLNIYGSRIGGAVLLHGQPQLEGGLLMDNSRVSGDVSFQGATVTSFPKGAHIAIAMARMRIDGSLTFAGGQTPGAHLQCEGTLWLYLCAVGGSLDIGETCLAGNYLATSLYARGLSVRSSVSMTHVIIHSSLLLEDSQIGGNLSMENVRVMGQGGVLSASGVRAEGAIRLTSNEFDECDWTGACCATFSDDKSSYREGVILRIDGLRYERIHDVKGSIKVEDRFEWWLPKDDLYRPQPYVQLAQVLANHGEDALVRRVLTVKAKQDADQAWNDGVKQVSTWCEKFFERAKWYGRKSFYYFIVCPFGFFFDFGLSPTKAVATVMAFIAMGWALFAFMDSRNALVVAQTPVTTLVHKDEADPNKFKFASAFVSKAVPRSESEAVNGPASVQSPLSSNVSTPSKNSVPTNKPAPVEGRVSAQKPVTVKVPPPVIKPAPVKEEASLAALQPVQKPVTAHTSAGGKENQHNDYSDSAVPCRDSIRLLVYAADVFIPLVDLREEGKCDIDQAKGSEASNLEITAFRLIKALYAILGWLVTGAAVVTVSGVMRHRLLRD